MPTRTASRDQDVAAPLDRSATLTRELVHRTALSEVLLSDLVPTTTGFLAAVQWPRRHHYFRTDRGAVDVTLVAETLRQVTIAVAHVGYGVPAGQRFIMDRIQLVRLARQADELASDGLVTAEVTVVAERVTRGRLQSLQLLVRFAAGATLLASGEGWLRVLPDEVYQRIRSASPRSIAMERDPDSWSGLRAPQHPRGVRLHPAGPGAWGVDVDLSHPVLFDHRLDHLPGMLVVEVCELAFADIARDPALTLDGFDGTYRGFLELGDPLEVRLRQLDIDGAGTAVFELTQNGLALVSAAVSARRPS
jgi:2-oxo-3-(phosphooxy)propyl 3-oxoalkanoate synthase